MGWMSWEIFRCETDCAKHPDTCISDKLYRSQVDGLKNGGFVAAGYTGIHMVRSLARHRLAPGSVHF